MVRVGASGHQEARRGGERGAGAGGTLPCLRALQTGSQLSDDKALGKESAPRVALETDPSFNLCDPGSVI